MLSDRSAAEQQLDEPLSSFEDYMFSDDRPGWPMTFLIRVELSEVPQVGQLQAAMQRTAQRHLRLAARIYRNRRGRCRWVPCSSGMDCSVMPAETAYDAPFPQPMNLETGPLWRAKIQPASGSPVEGEGTRAGVVWFEFHHAVCDGVGALQVITETFHHCAAARDEDCRHAGQDSGLPFHAGTWLPGAQKTLVAAVRQWFSVASLVARYMMLRPCSLNGLVDEPSSLLSGNGQAPRFLSTRLGNADVIRKTAKAAGGTVNDLLLRDAFRALADVTSRLDSRSRRFRIFIPMNLRDPLPLQAQNVVGMVHLDAVLSYRSNAQQLLQRICLATQKYRAGRLGRALLVSLEAVQRAFGSIRPLVNVCSCGATVVVSNLGPISGVEYPHSQPATRIDFAPPVRPLTPVTFGVTTCGDEIRVGMRYHPAQVTESTARFLLARIVYRMQESIQEFQPVTAASLSDPEPVAERV